MADEGFTAVDFLLFLGAAVFATSVRLAELSIMGAVFFEGFFVLADLTFVAMGKECKEGKEPKDCKEGSSTSLGMEREKEDEKKNGVGAPCENRPLLCSRTREQMAIFTPLEAGYSRAKSSAAS